MRVLVQSSERYTNGGWGLSLFVPHSKVGVEETAKYTTQHFDFKQNLQVGPRVEAQELIGEGAGRR